MRYLLISLLILFFTIPAFSQEPDNSAFRFIENKNQWDAKVLFLSDIKSGALFLEKNCFTYHLIDGHFLESLHAHKKSVNSDSLIMKGHVFKMHFENSNSDVVASGENSFSDYYNYFLGKDQSKWASKALAYKIINYQNLYEGIDLKVYTYNSNLKYDFIVLPNVNPSLIKLNYEGVDKLFLSEGSLVLQTSLGKIIEQRPYAYQNIQGRVVPVACHYVLDKNNISFTFPNGYDKSQKLIVDPTLIFSTYSGSVSDNFGYTATYDSDGFLYSGSSAFGTGYPTTVGAYQTNWAGGTPYPDYGISGIDIAITKYDTSGTKRIYSTYLGGNHNELPHSLIVDNDDNLLLLGTTSSANYPISQGAYDNTFNGGDSIITLPGIGVIFDPGTDIIISKLSNDGSALLASTFLGGSANDGILGLSKGDLVPYPGFPGYFYTVYRSSALRYNYADEVRGEIEVDKYNNIYIASCTKSHDFPIAGNSSTFKGGNFEAVVVKLNNSLTNVIWSTFLGGNKDDAAYSLEIDTLNNVYVSGGTNSSDFPTTTGVLYPSSAGGRSDGFITYLDNSSSGIIYSTYYGSSTYDQIYFVDLDNFNNVFVFGQTMAPGNTFIHNAGFSQPNSGQFISKITPELDSLIWSTTFGTGSGLPNISPTAFLVDLCSKIYLTGWGGTPESDEFISYPPITRPFNMLTTRGVYPITDFYQSTTDGKDFYLFVLEDDASAVNYASFFGGNISDEHVDGGTSRFDKKGKIYQAMCAGCGGNSDMTVKPPYGSTELPAHNNSDNCNIGVFKMDFQLPIVVADFTADPACSEDSVQFINKSLIKSATTYKWNFGDGNTSTKKNPAHVYAAGGTYNVRLIVSDNATCNLGDTVVKQIYISDINHLAITATADQYIIYKGKSTKLHANPNSGYLYEWTPSGSLSSAANPNPIASPQTTTTYTLNIADPSLPTCRINASVTINVIELICDEPYIYIPDAFTPNGDGNNDLLYVRSNNILDMFFTVYNRWGEKVFETKDQNIGWDGIYKGMKADPGVFVYYLEVTCLDDQKFFKKGNVTLIR